MPANGSFSIAAEVKALSLCHAYSFPRKLCVRLMSLHGLVLLFEVDAGPPHDGVRRVERFNLSGFLAAESGRICCPCELAPPIVPVRTS